MRGFVLREICSHFLITSVIAVDKLLPLFIILTGVIVGVLVRNLKFPFLRSM